MTDTTEAMWAVWDAIVELATLILGAAAVAALVAFICFPDYMKGLIE